MPQSQRANAYIKSLRNTAKRSYAERYWNWLMRGAPQAEGEPAYPGLSYMAAQAVRLRLYAITEPQVDV